MEPTAETVKEEILKQVRAWLDDPGNTQSLTLECFLIPIPPQNGGGTVRAYEVSAKTMLGSARIRQAEPSKIIPAHAVPTGPITGAR